MWEVLLLPPRLHPLWASPLAGPRQSWGCEQRVTAPHPRCPQGQVTRAQEAEENYVIKRELAVVRQQCSSAAEDLQKAQSTIRQLQEQQVPGRWRGPGPGHALCLAACRALGHLAPISPGPPVPSLGTGDPESPPAPHPGRSCGFPFPPRSGASGLPYYHTEGKTVSLHPSPNCPCRDPALH